MFFEVLIIPNKNIDNTAKSIPLTKQKSRRISLGLIIFLNECKIAL